MQRNRQWRTAARAFGGLAALFALVVSTVGGGTLLGRVGLAAKSLPANSVTPPSITAAPENPTYATDATFAFSSPDATSFRCRIDNKPFAACTSGISFHNLQLKTHSFEVLAVDSAGNTSALTSYSWEIVKKITFAVSGSAGGPLYPGVEQPINLVITNPHNFAVQVTRVDIAIAEDTSPAAAGCSGSENLTVSRPFAGPVTIPGNARVSLTGSVHPQARPWLLMPNLPKSQDECKNVEFELTYLATASKR